MTDKPETYDEWLERTKLPPSRSIGWESWVGVPLGVGLILGTGWFLGFVVLAISLTSVLRWMLGRRLDSEKVEQRIAVGWSIAWIVAAVVALVAESDRGWEWWVILVGVVVIVVVEGRGLVSRLRA